MATRARGGTLPSGSCAKPDWNDEPSESMEAETRKETASNFVKHCGEIMDPAWNDQGDRCPFERAVL
jgi:hypothetical protein